MVFRWSLSDRKSPQVSRIHLSILANFNREVLIIIIIIIIIIPCKFSSPAKAGGLSLESKWQQVSWDLQDSSQYSDRLPRGFCRDGHGSSFHIQLFEVRQF